jgi:glycolate oxidase iron-sulfur subunit
MAGMPSAPPGVAAADPGLTALADQCVMCGLCLPHCPTYRLDPVEAESPRGRIALARALNEGGLPPTAAMLDHLDRCLGCLSCQQVCPSGVRYEDILVRTRARLAHERPPAAPALRWARDPRRLLRWARLADRLRAHTWLPRLARLLPTGSPWRRMAETLPAPPGRAEPASPAVSARRGRIALFRGCVADLHDRDTLAAARVLLEACGFEVEESRGGDCCGALPRHQGDTGMAAELAAATRAGLEAAGADLVIGCASGCHGDLRDEVLAGSRLRLADAHAFLAGDAGFAQLRFRPLARRAALHLPCSQVNVVGQPASLRTLLGRIPGLELLELPLQPRCCGAAGSYFIEHPRAADRLRDEKLAQATALAPDLLLTTNIGCRLHLRNGLRPRDAGIEVLHPLALLARQLDNPHA